MVLTRTQKAEGMSGLPCAEPRQHSNFLLLQFQTALGTVVHATPLAQALREGAPGARIVVWSSGLAAQVWRGNPFIDQLVETASPITEFWTAVHAFRQVRAFDGAPYTTLLTMGNERTRITLAAVLAGRSRRVGFSVRHQLMSDALTYDPTLSQIANNLRIAGAVGLNRSSEEVSEPLIDGSREQTFAQGLLGPRVRPRIAFATQTSVTQRKSWPAERWVALVRELRERWDVEAVFVGTSEERPAIDALRAAMDFPTLSVAGETTIPQLAAVLKLCDLSVVLDTGAAACGALCGAAGGDHRAGVVAGA